MNYKIIQSDAGFYPKLIEDDGFVYALDTSIAKYLHLEFEEYINFIKENGGFSIGSYYYFKTEKDCQEFIENFIEPRLVMQKLMG